jgi:hypothetical protein
VDDYGVSGSSASPGAGGRPDERFPRPAVTELVSGAEVAVSIVATVNLMKKYGTIRYVTPVPGGRPSGIRDQSDVVLRAKRSDGEPIREYPVQVDLFSEPGPDGDREGLVNAVVPVSGETRSIELLIGAQVTAVVRVGGPLPAVRETQRLFTSVDNEFRVALTPETPMAEGSSYIVQISTDHGRTWQTVGIGLRAPVFSIDRAQFRQFNAVTVRVLASNGLSSSLVATEAFRP